MSLSRKVLFAFLFVFCSFLTYGGQEEQLDRPRIINFTKADYKADNQNWGITQDNNGIIYIANNRGLLSYDGNRWNCWPMPGKTIVRSVAVDDSGRIFAGSFEEFGYWKKNNEGNLVYTSLKNLVKNFVFHNEEIWKIIRWKGIIYFQSFSVVFAYDGSTVIPVIPPGFIDCFSVVNSRILMSIQNHGLFTLSGNSVVPIDTSSFFRNTLIRVLLPFSKSEMMIATADKGIFLYNEKNNLSQWNAEQQKELLNTSVNRGVVEKDGSIILGTILDGIFVFDHQGSLFFHLNKQNGLQNNTVLSLFTDMDGSLWAGLDNGIDLVNLDRSVTFFYDPSGKLGSVYTLLLKDQTLYAGTNQGLFCSPFIPARGGTKLDFSFIDNSQGQVWSLTNFDNQVICGHNDRTYEVAGNHLLPLSPVSGGYSIRRVHAGETDHLLQSTYTDLVIYKHENNRWVFSNTLAGFRNPSRYIETDHLGNVWVSHLQRGVFRMHLNADLKGVSDVKCYGKAQGFESDDHINVFKLQNRVVFTNEGQIYVYNDLYDTIQHFDFVEDHIRPGTLVTSIFSAGNNQYWFVSTNSLDLYEFSTGKIILRNTYPMDLFNHKLIRDNEFIYPLDSSRWLVCLENGMALITDNPGNFSIANKKTYINQIISSGRKIKHFSPSEATDKQPILLPFSQNSLEFYFSCPVYTSKIQFEVMLKGLDNQWVKVDQATYRYDRLPFGSYTFQVRAVDGRGNYSLPCHWNFVINAPWYWKTWTKIVYLIILLILFLLVRTYMLRKLKKQENKLSIEKEKELIRLRNEKLESEVHYKSMQLANTTYSIIKKNELLLDIKRMLGRSRKTADAAWQQHAREIDRLLDQNLTNEDDWSIFESNFEQAHEEFLKRIKKQYPELTPSDLKLCAFIRMNLPSKKIAPLLGISTRGVENHRYRLRHKMELDHDINLTDYLINF